MKSLKLKKICVFLITFLIIIILFCLFFFHITISVSDLNKFCITNSDINSKSFTREEIETNPNYAFWVSNDKNIKDKQELFIFREISFGFIQNTNRFVFISNQTSGVNEKVSSTILTPIDVHGREMPTNLMLFWSSNPYDISTYLIKFQENGNMCTLEGMVSSEQEFIVSLPKLGIDDYTNRTFIEAYFYDTNGNLVDKK